MASNFTSHVCMYDLHTNPVRQNFCLKAIPNLIWMQRLNHQEKRIRPKHCNPF
uniref:Uncharacterized protein n=1 Tax=Candidatus Nitrotoga fabula TaxID=2182327 RepID=A0A2X0QXR3_9PROT|nr:protein of unknown function [Candidatus Nitrotoga fabula]